MVAAVAAGVRSHVAVLKELGVEFYGYALLPGEPYKIDRLAVVTNTDSDVKVARSHAQYSYYRYCVEEWKRWERDQFALANKALAAANQIFASIHTREVNSYIMDDYEMAHSDALLDAIVCGLDEGRAAGAFGDGEPFLVVWISDSGHSIIRESVRRLNAPGVAETFMSVFR